MIKQDFYDRQAQHRVNLIAAVQALPLVDTCQLIAAGINQRSDLEFEPLDHLVRELNNLHWALVQTGGGDDNGFL